MSNVPEISVLPSDEQPDNNGRHRSGRRLHRGATALTAIVAAGAVAMAAYAGMPTGPALSADGLSNSLGEASPFAGEAALSFVGEESKSPLAAMNATLEQQVSGDSLDFSAWSSTKARTVALERSQEIAAERKAAEEAAAQKAAEEAAAQKAADEQAAEEAAEAEREQAASRSEERTEAPAQEAAPAPAPAPTPSGSPKSIAQSMLGNYGWGSSQWGCLEALWERESNWNPYAENPSSGAYGIPQSLPGNKMATAGSDWRTNPATQISWGLSYISGRYGTPCGAWAHSESVGWY